MLVGCYNICIKISYPYLKSNIKGLFQNLIRIFNNLIRIFNLSTSCYNFFLLIIKLRF